MKRFRALLIAALIIAMGTVSAFADIVPIDRALYRAKWYIVAAIVIIIAAIVFLRSAIRRKAEKSKAELDYEGYKKDESL